MFSRQFLHSYLCHSPVDSRSAGDPAPIRTATAIPGTAAAATASTTEALAVLGAVVLQHHSTVHKLRGKVRRGRGAVLDPSRGKSAAAAFPAPRHVYGGGAVASGLVPPPLRRRRTRRRGRGSLSTTVHLTGTRVGRTTEDVVVVTVADAVGAVGVTAHKDARAHHSPGGAREHAAAAVNGRLEEPVRARGHRVRNCVFVASKEELKRRRRDKGMHFAEDLPLFLSLRSSFLSSFREAPLRGKVVRVKGSVEQNDRWRRGITPLKGNLKEGPKEA